MRVVVKQYAQGGRNAYETTNDGGELLGEWTTPRDFRERTCGFIEVLCDDTEEGYRRLLESINWFAEEIRKRKLQPAETGADGKPTRPGGYPFRLEPDPQPGGHPARVYLTQYAPRGRGAFETTHDAPAPLADGD